MMKKLLCVLLTVLFISGMLPLSVFAKELEPAGASHTYDVGDIFELGSYPQTRIKDSNLISRLNSQSGTWVSYRYLIKRKQSDFMKFRDVTYNGEKYRAVKFDSYRSAICSGDSSAPLSNQDESGYYANTVYWFRYEPLKWRVIDPETGYVMCTKVIDSQQFYNADPSSPKRKINGKTVYDNNWEYSDIRTFLNDKFYDTAFSETEKNIIKLSDLSSDGPYSSEFPCNDTQDRVFVPSIYDVLKTTYGFSNDFLAHDTPRLALCTDYAKCQGLYTKNEYSVYWLRSPGHKGTYAWSVKCEGSTQESSDVDSTATGVRPGIKVNLQSRIIHAQFLTHIEKKSATCTSIGNTEHWFCPKCHKYYMNATGSPEIALANIIIKEKPHDFSDWKTETRATPTADGLKSRTCKNCGYKETASIPKTSNPFKDIPETSWYTDACLWCNKKGYITGTGDDTFNPSGTLTRAMFVQILAKVDGVDLSKVTYKGRFTDVKTGNWFAKSVQWAVDCGVTGGTGGNTFSPNSAVSREQLATFFMAYAKYKKYDTSATVSLAKYKDAGTVASWAKSAVTWAIAEGLISGTGDTTLSPKTSATRAQAAVIFKSFVEKYVAKQKK